MILEVNGEGREVKVLLELGLANPSAQSTGSLDLWWNWMEMERNEWPFLALWFVSQTYLGPGGGGSCSQCSASLWGCSQEALVGVQEADIWCCSALRRPAGCIYCCPEHLPHAGLGWAGLELCRAEDVPSPSVYIQAVRVSGTEKGVPRSYLQT